MIPKASDQKIKLRYVKKYGDSDIILGFYTTEFWQKLFQKDKLLAWAFFRDYVRFLTAVSAYAVGAILRYRHGSKTTGLILSMATLMWLFTLNSSLLPYFLKPLIFWFSPVFLFLSDKPILQFIHTDIQSFPLFCFTLTYGVLASVHVIMIYLGKGNPESNKRGNSWLYLLLSQATKRIPEHFAQMILEPLLIALAGYWAWLYNDPELAIFLWSGAFSVFLQEYLDYAWQKKNDSYF